MPSSHEGYARVVERDRDEVDESIDDTFDEDVDEDAARLETRNAEMRESMVARAHRKHGLAGAIVAGGMLAIDQVLGRRPKGTAGSRVGVLG